MDTPKHHATPVWRRVRLLAACAVVASCANQPAAQVITGEVASPTAVAVRAVDDAGAITAARVRSDNRFALALPGASRYRIEFLTASGVTQLYARDGAGLRALAFKVCTPGMAWDLGGIRSSGKSSGAGCDPAEDPNCKCDPTGNCVPGPPPCDPTKDPRCTCDPTGKCEIPPPPPCDPAKDPNCKCDPTGNCVPGPPPCDPAKDPNCKCDPTGHCVSVPPPCDPAKDPSCKCADPTDKNCVPAPPPACKDSPDANGCKDECVYEPSSCGCANGDPECWGEPAKPTCDAAGKCIVDRALTPDRAPLDFGCPEPSPELK